MKSFDFSEKVVVVTGGTRGIGFATVETFLEHNAVVILFGSREESAQAALTQLKDRHPGAPVFAMWPDLSSETAMQAAFAEIVKLHGRIDVLVNNAGISQSESLYNYAPGAFEKIMDLNVVSVFNGCRAVAPIMRQQGGGVILNTSSMVSRYGQRSGCGYPTSKFAVNGLTVSLARELGKDHIRVNAVAPGVIETDMVRNLPKEYIKPLLAGIPLRRFGQAEDIANAFLFLASDYAAYVSGEILSVDGATVE